MRRVLASVIAAVYLWTHCWQVAWGDAMQDTARQGQQLAEQLRRQGLMPRIDPRSGAVTLFPGTPATVTIPSQQWFPGAAGGANAETQTLFGDSAGISAATTAAQQRLETEATPTGEAYRTLIQSRQRAHPDLSRDPIWGTTDQVMGSLDQYARLFGDCRVAIRTRNESITAHVPDYRTCERTPRLGVNHCEIHHDPRVRSTPVEISVAAYGVEKNTFQVDLKNGAWQNVAPTDGQAFSVLAPTVDRATVCPSGAPAATRLVDAASWPDAPVPGDFDASTCYRVLQPPTCSNGLIAVVQLDDNCDESGPDWYKYAAHFRFDLQAVLNDDWEPAACLQTAQAGSDAFCQVSADCTEPPNADGCLAVNGTQLCRTQNLVQPAPLAGIDPLCRVVQVTSNCPFAYGRLACWTDPRGVRRCPVVTAANAASTTCESLERNPACGFVRSECIQGARGPSGECYAFTDVYDCGFTAGGATLALTEATYQCPGQVRCMGTDCVAPVTEHNQDFARAAAALQAAQTIAADAMCTAATPTEPVCELFKGVASECKKALGGVVDCCETPGGVSLGDYITLVLATLKLDSAMTSWNATSAAGQAIQGAWMTLREPIAQTWATVTQPFTSAVESIGGSVAEVGIQQALMNGAGEAVGQLFGRAAQEALFSCTGCVENAAGYMTGGTFTMNPALMAAYSVLSWIMWAYMIYQIAMILAQIIWECETDEFELGAKRELKACHYVGSYCASKVIGQCVEKRESYCCFSSPLSRILNEQIRPQLGMDWGDADDPDCRGIPVDRLHQVDWNRVNLDEWIGILAATGRLPTPENLSLEPLTGSGNLLNTTGNRPDTRQRTQERINQVDIDAIRNQVGQDLWSNPTSRP